MTSTEATIRMVRHNIRNSLNSIDLGVEVIKGCEIGEEVQALLASIEVETDKIERMLCLMEMPAPPRSLTG
jgi:hypothetical protein